MSAKPTLVVAAFVFLPLWAPLAPGFPPYRSTDAETADAGTVEVRLGLARIEREDQENAYASPLLRMNLGLPADLELISELEYRPDEEGLGDGAVGFKWVPFTHAVSIGVETLALLPVSPNTAGAGVESQLLATLRQDAFRLHLNAGGFYDFRPTDAERGWRASLLAETQKGRFRMGVEIFAKQEHSEPMHVQAGPGIIIDVGAFDFRTGLHVGLTREAPDLTGSLWVTWKWPVW